MGLWIRIHWLTNTLSSAYEYIIVGLWIRNCWLTNTLSLAYEYVIIFSLNKVDLLMSFYYIKETTGKTLWTRFCRLSFSWLRHCITKKFWLRHSKNTCFLSDEVRKKSSLSVLMHLLRLCVVTSQGLKPWTFRTEIYSSNITYPLVNQYIIRY